MRSAEGRSGKTVPDTIVPERGQVPENLAEELSSVQSKEPCDILNEHVSGSKLANDAPHLSPQNGFGVSEALFLACAADSLAGEAAGDDIDGSSVS